MRLAVAAIAAATAVAAPATTRAEYGIPSWMGTWTGSSIPTQGTLYMFQDNLRGFDGPPELTWTGVGNAEAIQIADNVFQINYSGIAGSTLVVRPRFGEESSYTLDTSWQPPQGEPRVLQYWHDKYEWTCSSSEALMLQTDQEAAAYRIRWTFHGVTRELVLPPSTDFQRSALELGKINCGGETLPLDELRAGGHLELVAIRLDRSEIPVTGLPATIVLGALPLADNGLDHAMMVQPRPPVAAPPAHAGGDVLGNLRGALVLAVIALGLVFAWCTRVRPHDAP
jgi:hypothetical protein